MSKDESKTGEEAEGTEGEGTEGTEETLTPEEIAELREENESLKRAAATKRTEKARAAKAAKTQSKSKTDDDDPTAELRRELAEERAGREKLEARVQRRDAEKIAERLGASDADAVVLLLVDQGVDLADEDDVKIAARDLLKARPHLKKAATKVDAGEGTGKGPAKRGLNEIIREAARR